MGRSPQSASWWTRRVAGEQLGGRQLPSKARMKFWFSRSRLQAEGAAAVGRSIGKTTASHFFPLGNPAALDGSFRLHEKEKILRILKQAASLKSLYCIRMQCWKNEPVIDKSPVCAAIISTDIRYDHEMSFPTVTNFVPIGGTMERFKCGQTQTGAGTAQNRKSSRQCFE